MAQFVVEIATQGSEQAQADLAKLLNAAQSTSTEIIGLSKSLSTSANSAAAFANQLGLSAGVTSQAVNRIRDLKDAGADNANIFKILKDELGITATQYKNLVLGLKDADRQVDAFTQSIRDQETAQEAANKAAMDAAQAAAGQLLALQQLHGWAQQVNQSLQAFSGRAVSAFIEYDDALTSVSAKALVAKDQLGFLEESARKVALATSQTPAGALRAADSLLSLGATARQASDRLLTVAQLADAFRTSGGTIEDSARIVQLAIQVYGKFGVTAEDVGNKISLLGDTTAASTLGEFNQLFSKAGGLAAQLGISMDELLASFGELRNAGQAPEVAATSMKSLISEILVGRKKLEDLGITVFKVGADGKEQFAGLANVMEQIGKKGLSTTQMVKLFGKIGVASAITLSQNYQSVNDRIAALGEQTDTLTKKSAIINSSIQGQITILQGSISAAFVDLGRGLSSFAGPAVNVGLQLVNAFIGSNNAVKLLAASLLGLGTALSGGVVAITGIALAFKAWQAAEVGQTISTAAAAVAIQLKAANLRIAAAAGNEEARASLLAAAAAREEAAAVAASAAANGAQTEASLASAGAARVQAGALASTATAMGLLVAAFASIAIAYKTYEAITGEANKTRQATDELSTSIDNYEKSLGVAIPAQKGFTDNFQKFIKNIKEATANIPLLSTAVDFYSARITAAKINQNSIAFGEFQNQLNRTNQIFVNLKQSNKLATDEAANLLPVLKQQLLVLEQFVPKTESEITVRAASIKATKQQIEAINQASGATKSNTDALKDNKDTIKDVAKAYNALSTDMKSAIADLEENISSKLVAVNNDVKLSAKERSAAVSNIESQGAKERLKIIEDFIQKRKQITGLNAKQEKENQKEITELEKEAGSIRVDIAKKFAEQREEKEKRVLEAIKAQREAALQSELQQIDRTTAAYRQQANDRVQFQKSILEGLDDEKTALSNQLSLLQESATTADLQGKAKVAAIDQEIKGLQNARGLIQAINSGELNRQQFILAQNELRKLGLDQSATDEQIQRRIQAAQEARRQAELTNLLQQQESQRQQLALQQEIERVDLRRKVAEAEIALINTQLEVNLANQNVLRAQAEASAANLELIEARRNGASQAELINLQSQLNAKKDAVGLAQQQVKLAEQQVGLSGEQLQDAKGAIGESEKLFAAQTKNLTLQQQQAVKAKEAADESERLNVALDGALSSASGTANALERGAKAAKETASAFDRMVEANIKDIQSGGKTAKVSPDGQPTQYFVRGKEVSAQEYEAAVNKPSSQSSISISAQMDTSSNDPLVIKQVIDGLERFKANNAAILSASHLPVSPMPDVDAAIEKLTKKLSDVLAATKQGITQDRDGKYILLPVVGARAESVLYPVVGARAGGGSVSGGLPYLVGERGPELFVPKVTGTIVPNVPGGFTDTSRIEALLTQLVNRPLPNVNPNFTFVNEPNPLQAQVNLLQSQLRAARGV